jgi:nucleoside recognition membrane protein YjiH
LREFDVVNKLFEKVFAARWAAVRAFGVIMTSIGICGLIVAACTTGYWLLQGGWK